MVLDAALAEGPNVQNVGPFDDNDAGTDVLRSRYFIYVPGKYAHIILEQHLTPRQAWERLGGAIIADNAADSCVHRLDACNLHLTFREPSISRATCSPVSPTRGRSSSSTSSRVYAW
jgi:hypothetical protein